jgi:hypothetical protein
MNTEMTFAKIYKLPRAALIQLAHTVGAVDDYTRMLGNAPELEAWPHSDLTFFVLEHEEWAVS